MSQLALFLTRGYPRFSAMLPALEKLNENLKRKALAYQAPALRHVFLLNNYDHIQRTLRKASYLSILQSASPSVSNGFCRWLRLRLVRPCIAATHRVPSSS